MYVTKQKRKLRHSITTHIRRETPFPNTLGGYWSLSVTWARLHLLCNHRLSFGSLLYLRPVVNLRREAIASCADLVVLPKDMIRISNPSVLPNGKHLPLHKGAFLIGLRLPHFVFANAKCTQRNDITLLTVEMQVRRGERGLIYVIEILMA